MKTKILILIAVIGLCLTGIGYSQIEEDDVYFTDDIFTRHQEWLGLVMLHKTSPLPVPSVDPLLDPQPENDAIDLNLQDSQPGYWKVDFYLVDNQYHVDFYQQGPYYEAWCVDFYDNGLYVGSGCYVSAAEANAAVAEWEGIYGKGTTEVFIIPGWEIILDHTETYDTEEAANAAMAKWESAAEENITSLTIQTTETLDHTATFDSLKYGSNEAAYEAALAAMEAWNQAHPDSGYGTDPIFVGEPSEQEMIALDKVTSEIAGSMNIDPESVLIEEVQVTWVNDGFRGPDDIVGIDCIIRASADEFEITMHYLHEEGGIDGRNITNIELTSLVSPDGIDLYEKVVEYLYPGIDWECAPVLPIESWKRQGDQIVFDINIQGETICLAVNVHTGEVISLSELIQKAEEKIRDHQNNISIIKDLSSQEEIAESRFNEIWPAYEDLFNKLKEETGGDNPFEHIDVALPDIYVPIQEALNRSNEEINILLKAIEEGDVDVIMAHLGISIEEVGLCLQHLPNLIDLYNGYSDSMRNQMAEIMAHLKDYSIKEEARRDLASRLRISWKEIAILSVEPLPDGTYVVTLLRGEIYIQDGQSSTNPQPYGVYTYIMRPTSDTDSRVEGVIYFDGSYDVYIYCIDDQFAPGGDMLAMIMQYDNSGILKAAIFYGSVSIYNDAPDRVRIQWIDHYSGRGLIRYTDYYMYEEFTGALVAVERIRPAGPMLPAFEHIATFYYEGEAGRERLTHAVLANGMTITYANDLAQAVWGEDTDRPIMTFEYEPDGMGNIVWTRAVTPDGLIYICPGLGDPVDIIREYLKWYEIKKKAEEHLKEVINPENYVLKSWMENEDGSFLFTFGLGDDGWDGKSFNGVDINIIVSQSGEEVSIKNRGLELCALAVRNDAAGKLGKGIEEVHINGMEEEYEYIHHIMIWPYYGPIGYLHYRMFVDVAQFRLTYEHTEVLYENGTNTRFETELQGDFSLTSLVNRETGVDLYALAVACLMENFNPETYELANYWGGPAYNSDDWIHFKFGADYNEISVNIITGAAQVNGLPQNRGILIRQDIAGRLGISDLRDVHINSVEYAYPSQDGVYGITTPGFVIKYAFKMVGGAIDMNSLKLTSLVNMQAETRPDLYANAVGYLNNTVNPGSYTLESWQAGNTWLIDRDNNIPKGTGTDRGTITVADGQRYLVTTITNCTLAGFQYDTVQAGGTYQWEIIDGVRYIYAGFGYTGTGPQSLDVIKGAMAIANAGDVIIVASGTYGTNPATDALCMKSGVRLLGGYNEAGVRDLVNTPTIINGFIAMTDISNSELNGFVIHCPFLTQCVGTDRSQNIRILNNSFYDSPYAIKLLNNSNVTIANNDIHTSMGACWGWGDCMYFDYTGPIGAITLIGNSYNFDTEFNWQGSSPYIRYYPGYVAQRWAGYSPYVDQTGDGSQAGTITFNFRLQDGSLIRINVNVSTGVPYRYDENERLIRLAQDKIAEYNVVVAKDDERAAAVDGFYNAQAEYEDLFSQLPPDAPFTHIEMPEIQYTPPDPSILDTIRMSREERDILENAIREGDFETIRQHIRVTVGGVDEAIQFLNGVIGFYNGYAQLYSACSAEIRSYLDRIRNEDPLIREAKAVLGIDDIASYETILPPEHSCDYPTVTKFYDSAGRLVGQHEVGGYIGTDIWYRVDDEGNLIIVKIGGTVVDVNVLPATEKSPKETSAEVETPKAPTVNGDSTVGEKIAMLQAAQTQTDLPQGIGLTGEMAQDQTFKNLSKLN